MPGPAGLGGERVEWADDRSNGVPGSEERTLECEVCGERVAAAVYLEHLLKECPGE